MQTAAESVGARNICPLGSDCPAERVLAEEAKLVMAMPREKAPDLVQSLLLQLPPGELAEAKPVVLYFDSDEDAAEFVTLVKQSKPGLRAVTRAAEPVEDDPNSALVVGTGSVG